MGLEREDRLARRRDAADGAIAVLHRKGERTVLGRRPHALGDAFGNLAAEDEALGASAEPGPKRLDLDLARTGPAEDLGPELGPLRAHIPERADGASGSRAGVAEVVRHGLHLHRSRLRRHRAHA